MSDGFKEQAVAALKTAQQYQDDQGARTGTADYWVARANALASLAVAHAMTEFMAGFTNASPTRGDR